MSFPANTTPLPGDSLAVTLKKILLRLNEMDQSQIMGFPENTTPRHSDGPVNTAKKILARLNAQNASRMSAQIEPSVGQSEVSLDLGPQNGQRWAWASLTVLVIVRVTPDGGTQETTRRKMWGHFHVSPRADGPNETNPRKTLVSHSGIFGNVGDADLSVGNDSITFNFINWAASAADQALNGAAIAVDFVKLEADITYYPEELFPGI